MNNFMHSFGRRAYEFGVVNRIVNPIARSAEVTCREKKKKKKKEAAGKEKRQRNKRVKTRMSAVVGGFKIWSARPCTKRLLLSLLLESLLTAYALAAPFKLLLEMKSERGLRGTRVSCVRELWSRQETRRSTMQASSRAALVSDLSTKARRLAFTGVHLKC